MSDEYNSNNTNFGELHAGKTPRRWEPEQGVSKLNSKIHKESKFADTYKNLPYSFRKPLKPLGSNSLIKCDNCGSICNGTTATVGIVCRHCNKFSKVTEV